MNANARRIPRATRAVAALCTALVLASTLAAPTALAGAGEIKPGHHQNLADEATSPPMFDLLVLRPLGMIGAGIGTLFFLVPVAPLTLITRPKEIGKPFEKMVMNPARYVVADPLGKH